MIETITQNRPHDDGPLAVVIPLRPHNANYAVTLAAAQNAELTLLRHGFLDPFDGHTRSAYQSDLDQFARYCATRGLHPLQVQDTDLFAYLRFMTQVGRAPSTKARHTSTLRRFYAYVAEEQGWDRSPARRVRARGSRNRILKPALTVEELRAFLAAADHSHPRVRALAWLLATTGLRISEACHADRANIRHAQDGVWVDILSKGNVPTSIPLQPECVDRLQPLRAGSPTGPLFRTRTGRALDRNDAARDLKRLAVTAGISDFHPHRLRHTYITLARAAGADLFDLQAAVGHANVATTQSYDRTVLGRTNHPSGLLLAHLFPPSTATDTQVAS